MKKNIVGIILFIIGLLVIGFGMFFILSEEKEPPKQKEPEVVTPQGADSGMTPEEFYNWETNLNIRTAEIMDETFNDEYTLNSNGEFKITLKELQTKYNVNLSEYNTGTISCDLENSIIVVTKENDEYIKTITIKCTNSAE